MLNLKRRAENFGVKYFPFFLLFWGVVLRIRQYLSNESLRLDEANLVLNIIKRSFNQLTLPLDYHQIAPLGYLYTEKFLTEIWGIHEYVLRLPAFVAGIFSLVLFYIVSRRHIKEGFIYALLLVSIAHPLIYFSAQVKPYMLDMVFTLLIYYFLFNFLAEPTWRKAFIFSLLGAVTVWFSFPVVFVLSGISLVLVFKFFKEKRNLSLVIGFIFFWVLSFLLNYVFFLKPIIISPVNQVMQDYWKEAFINFGEFSRERLDGVVSLFFKIFENPLSLSNTGLAFFIFLVGIGNFYKSKREKFFYLLFPLLVLLLASTLGKYPLQGRLIIFLAPIFIWFLGVGLDYLVRLFLNTDYLKYILIGGLLGVLLLRPLAISGYMLLKPLSREEIKPALKYILKNWKKGDVIYLYYGAIPAFKYYSKLFKLQNFPIVEGKSYRNDWIMYEREIVKLSGKRRVWIIFSHVCIWEGVDEEKLFLMFLNKHGRCLQKFTLRTFALQKNNKVSAYLYSFK